MGILPSKTKKESNFLTQEHTANPNKTEASLQQKRERTASLSSRGRTQSNAEGFLKFIQEGAKEKPPEIERIGRSRQQQQ
jgi:hypothetical protein